MDSVVYLWESVIKVLLTPIAIIIVGYWVNTTIRKKNQRESVIVDYLQGIQKEIHRNLLEAIDEQNIKICTLKLRRLSNEILHLLEVYGQLVKVPEEEKNKRLNEMLPLFYDIKRNLTGIEVTEERRERARYCGNQLRGKTLNMVFHICESQK